VLKVSALLTELQRLRAENEELRGVVETHATELATLDRVKEDFIATASHDLKSPLTSILGYAQYAERLLNDPEPNLARLANALAIIRNETVAMTRLLNDLLDAARVQAGVLLPTRAPCDLGVSLATVLDRLPPVDRARITVRLASEPLAGEWDCPRVEQVIANLVDNALKYSPESASISIVIERHADRVEVEVSDQGMGIPTEELGQLFERFYRTPQAIESGLGGSGLGLYIAAGIIAAHGGRLSAESPGEGGGSTFRFTLPDPVPGAHYSEGPS
jgi:signal transduction histidine kinase